MSPAQQSGRQHRPDRPDRPASSAPTAHPLPKRKPRLLVCSVGVGRGRGGRCNLAVRTSPYEPVRARTSPYETGESDNPVHTADSKSLLIMALRDSVREALLTQTTKLGGGYPTSSVVCALPVRVRTSPYESVRARTSPYEPVRARTRHPPKNLGAIRPGPAVPRTPFGQQSVRADRCNGGAMVAGVRMFHMKHLTGGSCVDTESFLPSKETISAWREYERRMIESGEWVRGTDPETGATWICPAAALEPKGDPKCNQSKRH